MAGTRVPGCTAHTLESGGFMWVTPTVQQRIKDGSLVAALGLDPTQVAAFRTRIDAGTYFGPTDGGGELLPVAVRKCGVAVVALYDGAGNRNNPWTIEQQHAALEDLQPAWWHNFEPSSEGISLLSNGGYFVPMLVDVTDHTPAKIATAVANAQGGYIMSLGEADGHGWTVQQGIDAWGALVTDAAILARPDIKLGSPYTVTDGSVAGSWFQLWYAGIKAAGYRTPDFFDLDKYGSSNGVTDRVNNYFAAFPEISDFWIPEYAIDTGSSVSAVPQSQEIPYMQLMSQTFDRDRYAKLTHHAKWLLGPRHFTIYDWHGREMYDDAAQPMSTAAVWRDCGRYLPI